MTKQESINKFLVEQEGECWHVWILEKNVKGYGGYWQCEKCEVKDDGANELINPDFSKPENLLRLLKIAKTKGIRIDISQSEITLSYYAVFNSKRERVGIDNIDDIPSTLSECIAEELGWKEER